jgi:actin, other eukaryote
MTEASPIVIDNGSGVCKAGECKNGQPSSVFPSIVGIPKVKNVIEGLDPKELYLGSEANEKRGVLNITYPIEHGVITNWTFMEALWRHVFVNELRVTPEEDPSCSLRHHSTQRITERKWQKSCSKK